MKPRTIVDIGSWAGGSALLESKSTESVTPKVFLFAN